jgi:hypothetical protein
MVGTVLTDSRRRNVGTSEMERRRRENLAVVNSKPHIRGVTVFHSLKGQIEKARTLAEVGRNEAGRKEFFGTMKKNNPGLYITSFRVPDEELIGKVRKRMSEFHDRIRLS